MAIANGRQAISNHLLELQKEIKEEEDEIFADINSLINDRLCPSPEPEQDQSIHLNHLHQHQHQHQNHQPHQNQQQQQQHQQLQQQLQVQQKQQLQLQHQHPPLSSSLMSCNDEQELDLTANLSEQDLQYPDDYGFSNLNNNDDPELQAIIKKVTSNLPKPCVFFLEGNCRRSDCRYSHDLSRIICKYWIEGFCFKGELCPFLHCYDIPESSLSDDDSDDPLASKRQQMSPTFVIESEVDFPSLAGE